MAEKNEGTLELGRKEVQSRYSYILWRAVGNFKRKISEAQNIIKITK